MRRLLVLCWLVCGCTSPHLTHDAPPKHPPSMRRLRAIREPTPRWEPNSRYGNPPAYTVLGHTYRVWSHRRGHKERGWASWYGTKFHGRRTSSGEPYDMYRFTGAHRHLPLPTYARVTNLDNHKSVVIRINDRGPFHPHRMVDLSYVAAARLGMLKQGTARVELEVIAPRPTSRH